MPLNETLRLLIELDNRGAIRAMEQTARTADRDLGRTEDRIDRMGARFTKAGAVMLGTAGLLAGGLYKAGQAASDLNEAVGQTGNIFGDASSEIEDFADGMAQMGQSKTDALNAANALGGLLDNLGFARDETVQWSQDLVRLGSDLGSAFNRDPAEAVQAIGSALRGESEPIRAFNVMLDDASIRAKAVEMGLAATTAEVDRHGKAQATLAIIMEQTTSAQGDFARTSDGAANSMRIASAEMDNAMASLGQAAAPIIAEVAGAVAGLAQRFNELSPGQQESIAKFITFGTIALGLIGTLSTISGWLVTLRTNLAALGVAGAGAFGWAGAAIVGGLALSEVAKNLKVDWGEFFDLDFDIGISWGDEADRAREYRLELRKLVDMAGQNWAGQLKRAFVDSGGALDGNVERIAAMALAAEGLFDVVDQNLGGWDEFWGQLQNDPAASYTLGVLTDNMRINGEITEETAVKLMGFVEGLNEARRAGQQSASVNETLGDSVEDVGGSIDYTTGKFWGFADALGVARKTFSDWIDDVSRVHEAEDAYEDAIDGIIGALEEHKKAVAEHGDTSREAFSSFRDVVGEVDSAIQNAARRAEETGDVKAFDQAREDVYLLAAALNDAGVDVDEVFAKLRALERKFVAEVEIRAGSVPIIQLPGPQAPRPRGNGALVIDGLPGGAEGAIVTKPTLALIGEAGPEVLTPLDRMPGASPIRQSMVEGASEMHVSFHVDGQLLAQAVERASLSAPLRLELRPTT